MFAKDILGEIAAMDSHVFEDLHVRAKKELFEVACTVASATLVLVGDDAVDLKFGFDNANSQRANVLKSIEAPVTANSHANSVGFRLAGAHGADKGGIGDYAASGNLVKAD